MSTSIARTLRLSRKSLRPSIALPRLSPQIRYGSSDYGSPEKHEGVPAEKGSNPSADIEHPGPPPPKVGQNTGSGGTKADADGHDATTPSKNVKPTVGNVTQKKSFSTFARRAYAAEAGASGKTIENAKPKILAESKAEDVSDEVRAHNEEVSKRSDNANQDSGEKVKKDFWKGDVGTKEDATA